jgi:mevalonate kinase
MIFSMHTNGKLLLTAEYFITEGATGLALPTVLGQSIEVTDFETEGIVHWESLDHTGAVWFQATFALDNFDVIDIQDIETADPVAATLQDILGTARQLNPSFLKDAKGLKVVTKLDFDRSWGLGSSATLVRMIAEWAAVDPFLLLEETFGGSGYDLVTATADGPVLFQKFNGKNRWEASGFNPSFKDQLYFVHLNQKQNSRDAMVYYKITPEDERTVHRGRITQITHNVNTYITELEQFEDAIEEHEQLVQSVIQQPLAKETYFSDYWGSIKSLGAWGGDFVLVTSDRSAEETTAYFKEKGFETILPYRDLIKEA